MVLIDEVAFVESHGTTQQTILASALSLMQRCGYHAFSYADIADQIGIRKASIHYYFPSKQDLAQAVVAHYRATARAGLAQLQHAVQDPAQQLEAYIAYFGEEVEGQPRICLCALLAAEMLTLPEPVRAEVRGYYQEHEAWLAAVLESGQQQGRLHFNGAASIAAQTLLAALEGAMLAARTYGQRERYLQIGAHVLQQYRG
ncbi:TetR/AcrR family transcriptional regulator [Chloroflexia bacterium SDU3-3]|nr:TetR/AcrR family transcriptional regulator [Chloroflexia bacterium SDU3-3]